jgi:hypothetical protein
MKWPAIYWFLFMMGFCLHLVGQTLSDPLSRPVSFRSDSVSKKELLDSLEKSMGIFFSYNPNLIGAEEKIPVDVQSVSLSQLLRALVNPEKVSYTAIGNQIIFFPAGEKESPTVTVIPSIVFKGTLLDERKLEPLPYCNIMLLERSIGTISNQDGKFMLKIPGDCTRDTVRISCMGYYPQWFAVAELLQNTDNDIILKRSAIQLKSIDVVHFNPRQVLDSFHYFLEKNYEENFVLLTTYYREVIKQNTQYTDISEAIMEVMKAPYQDPYSDDHIKFVKGRKSSDTKPYSSIKLKLKGGPYYILQLDVVKNLASFLDPEYKSLYQYTFEKAVLINNRETVVLGFNPLLNLRDVLYQGKMYIDRKTWALSRVEFEVTKEGLREARNLLIEKEPKKMKAIPVELSYSVDYQNIGDRWYFFTATTQYQIKVNDRQNRQKTLFNSVSEILTTKIEQGDFQKFSRRDIFKPNEFITEKIDTIDHDFWRGYNIIEPEDDLVEAIRGFESYNLIIKQISSSIINKE